MTTCSVNYFIYILSSRLDDAKKYRNQDRDTIARLNQQVSDLEAEVNLLRRTVDSLETDRSRDRDRIKSVESEVDRLRLVSTARCFSQRAFLQSAPVHGSVFTERQYHLQLEGCV